LDTFHYALGFLWFFLFAQALLFLGVEIRCRFDKSFLFHGGALLLLCAFTGIDLWVLPATSAQESLAFIRIQHLTFLFFGYFTLTNILDFLGTRNTGLLRATFFVTILLSVLTFSNLIIKVEDGEVVTGILYLPLFGTYLPLTLITLIALIGKGISQVAKPEKRILRSHLIGLILLGLCGGLDMLNMAVPLFTAISSITLIGTLLYGLAVSSIFVDRFLQVLKDKENAFQKLELAYRELENANNLKEIGESTAIVNHEIKNYMFMISGNAQLLKEMEPLTLRGQEMVGSIISSVERMTQFSKDILDMSRAKIVLEKHPINLNRLLNEIIQLHFQAHSTAIAVEASNGEQVIYGDWGRLEQVFINLIKNALEATLSNQAPHIRIKIHGADSLVMVSVEDQGMGCTPDQLKQFFKAFVTTKRRSGGTGLGLSIVKNIVESHGGRISAYSDPAGQSAERGTRIMMSFPNFHERQNEGADNSVRVVLVRNQLEAVDPLLHLLRNICVSPVLVDNLVELHRLRELSHKTLVLASAQTVTQNYPVFRDFPHMGLVSQMPNALFVLDYAQGRLPKQLTEEYLFLRLMEIKKSRPIRGAVERQVTMAE